MKDLIEHLNLASPLIWVVTDEPDRATDLIAAHSRRKLYRMDPSAGLKSYDKDKEEWKLTIVEVVDPETKQVMEVTTKSPQLAMHHVIEERGALLVYNSHQIVKDQIDFLAHLHTMYRSAVFTNDEELAPAQIIMISCEDDIPPELVHHIVKVVLPLPDAQEFAQIVTFMSKNSPKQILPKDIDLSTISRAAQGLTEAEFVQACLTSVRSTGVIDAEFINQFKRDKIKDRGILEIRRPRIGLDDIGGLDRAKEIIEGVRWMWDNPQQAKAEDLSPLRRLLLVGVPGTGKSAICEATAHTLGLDLAITGMSKALSMWVGQSEANMRAAFRQLAQLAPVVGWIDELGRDANTGSFSGDSGTSGRTQGEFLSGMQDLPEDVLMMAAANDISGLPPELLRAGRFDQILFVGFPTAEERYRIFEIHLGKLAGEFDLESLAAASPMFTGAEIQAAIAECKFRTRIHDKRHFNTNDLMAHLPNMRNRIWLKHPAKIKGMYQTAVEEWDWASTGQQAEAQMILSGQVPSAGMITADSNIRVRTF